MQSLHNKITIFLHVCNYLNNEGLHKIPNKKKLSRDELTQRHEKNKQFSQRVELLRRTKRGGSEIELKSRKFEMGSRPVQEIVV